MTREEQLHGLLMELDPEDVASALIEFLDPIEQAIFIRRLKQNKGD